MYTEGELLELSLFCQRLGKRNQDEKNPQDNGSLRMLIHLRFIRAMATKAIPIPKASNRRMRSFQTRLAKRCR